MSAAHSAALNLPRPRQMQGCMLQAAQAGRITTAHLHSFASGQAKGVGDDGGVDAPRQQVHALGQQGPADHHHRGGAVSGHHILQAWRAPWGVCTLGRRRARGGRASWGCVPCQGYNGRLSGQRGSGTDITYMYGL